MKAIKIALLILITSGFFLVGCNSLPKGESFKYSEGEIVYYRIDNVPMIIDKQIYKNGEKKYKVVFKKDDGYLHYNTVKEEDLLKTPNQTSGDTN